MERVRTFFAPRTGWRRVYHYWRHRMKRLPDSPSRIALGFACGVYTSFTPFFGFHFVVAAGLAWVLRGNVFSSAIGTFIGNPVTFPFIAAVCIEMGGLFFGFPIELNLDEIGFVEMLVHFLQNLHELVIPYFVGGLIPGLICAVASYYTVKPIISTYQRKRRNRLMARARSRMAAQVAETGERK